MTYEVQTEVFQGPFDLLLDLILKEEVDLWEVSIARIVDAFLHEVERMERVDLDSTTQFLLVAATLVDLKTRRLLPVPESVELDEELLRFEARDLLLARLLECKTFKDVAREFEARFGVAGRSVARTAGPEEPFRSLVPDPLESLNPVALARAADRAFAPKPEPPQVTLDHVTLVRFTVRDAIEEVLALLPDREHANFRDLVSGAQSKIEVVVRFLAVLELFKQGFIDLEQVSTFGDLKVRRLSDGEDAGMVLDLSDWDEDDLDLADTDHDGVELDTTIEV
ncbi:MAG: segregation and condensation protein A [Acidimicrobiia bacterium]